jgi:hypothetical protein
VAIPFVIFSAFANATNVPFTVPPVTLSNVKPPLDVTSIAPLATGSWLLIVIVAVSPE